MTDTSTQTRHVPADLPDHIRHYIDGAFVDSAGRVTKRLPTHVEAVATADVSLDRRLTAYTRWGDAFAKACAAATALLVAWALWRRRVEHRIVRLPL